MEVHAWCNGALDPATVVFFRLVDLSEAYMLVVFFLGCQGIDYCYNSCIIDVVAS
jgi:hypothetical protein